MSIVTMYPVVDCYDLERAVNRQFDCEIEDISTLLFDNDYNNDSYKSFYFREMETYDGHFWQNEEDIRLRNLVRAYLQDIVPDYDRVLINVSW